MRIGVSTRLVKSGLAVGLLFAMVSMSGCEGNKEGTEGRTSDSVESSTRQTEVAIAAARVENLKARLVDEPENQQLLSALGDALFEAHRFQEAIPVYEKAIRLDPLDADALNDLGLAYFYTGETDKALDSITSATVADPAYKNAWLSKGFVLITVGKHDEAVAPLNRVKELDPGGALAAEADRFLQRLNTGP